MTVLGTAFWFCGDLVGKNGKKLKYFYFSYHGGISLPTSWKCVSVIMANFLEAYVSVIMEVFHD